MGYAQQVIGRAGTESALTILKRMQVVWAYAQRRLHEVPNEENGSCDVTHIPDQVHLRVLLCS